MNSAETRGSELETNFLHGLYHTARKVAPSVLWAVVLLTVSLATALLIAWPFGRTAYDAFEDYAIRWTLVVSMFFLGGLVVFSDRNATKRHGSHNSTAGSLRLCWLIAARNPNSPSIDEKLDKIEKALEQLRKEVVELADQK